MSLSSVKLHLKPLKYIFGLKFFFSVTGKSQLMNISEERFSEKNDFKKWQERGTWKGLQKEATAVHLLMITLDRMCGQQAEHRCRCIH
jgi:hypothetical protein